jgi:HAE1 family hydrophobic/amphiphilic exporter-1
MGREFIPEVDQGNFVIKLTADAGASLEATETLARRAGATVLKEPEVKDVFINIGHDSIEKTEKALGDFEPNIAWVTVVLHDSRQRSVKDIVDGLRPKISKIPEMAAEYVLNQNVTRMLQQKQAAEEILEIKGPDLQTIMDLTKRVKTRLEEIEYIQDVQSNLAEDETEIKISVDRPKAATFKLSVKDIADTLKTAIEGELATKFHDGDQEIDIVVKLRE